MRLEHLSALNKARAERRAIILVTDIASGDQRLVMGEDLATDTMADVLDPALRSGKSGGVEHGGKAWFLTVQTPPVRLIVIGAVHISQALAPLAKVAGLDLTIIDPRQTDYAALTTGSPNLLSRPLEIEPEPKARR